MNIQDFEYINFAIVMIVVSRPTSLAGQSWQSCGPRPAPATSLGQVARPAVPCETARFAAVQTAKRLPAGGGVQGEGYMF